MDIEELNGAWNSLMGKATKRKMAGELDDRDYKIIWRASRQWRKWYKQAGPLDDMFATATTSKFVRRYRAALKKAQAVGVHPEEVLQMTAIEQASSAGDQLSTIILISAGLGAATLIALVVASNRGSGLQCD